LCESLASKPGPTPSQLKSAIKSIEEGQQDDGGVEAAELAKKLEEEENRRTQTKKDVFAPENWDSLLADEFDGGLGESYGVLLVSRTLSSVWQALRQLCNVYLADSRSR